MSDHQTNGTSRVANIVTSVGVGVGILAGFWAILIRPLEARFAEVETQFYWSGDVEAGERADNARIQQLLWRKVYGEDLPPKNPYQRGPTKK